VENGWFYLGESFSRAPGGMIVKANEEGALAEIKTWEKVWDDSGSGKARSYSFWRGIPPTDDYIVIGGILSNDDGYAAPTPDHVGGIRAIRKDLVARFEPTIVWSDSGSGSKKCGSVWVATSANDAFEITNSISTSNGITYTFSLSMTPFTVIPMGSDSDYRAPPAEQVYYLDKRKIPTIQFPNHQFHVDSNGNISETVLE
jgi:hypothetical protein